MVINTADCIYEVASVEDVAKLHYILDAANTRIGYINNDCQVTSNTVDEIANDLAMLKEKVDRLIEMYGVVQLRCDDDINMLHVDLSNQGDLSGLFGGNV